jgi:hypothetical protein
MNRVEVLEDFVDDTIRVSVNGVVLKDANGKDRTFPDTFKAAIAGTKEVDRLRAAGEIPMPGVSESEKHT